MSSPTAPSSSPCEGYRLPIRTPVVSIATKVTMVGVAKDLKQTIPGHYSLLIERQMCIGNDLTNGAEVFVDRARQRLSDAPYRNVAG